MNNIVVNNSSGNLIDYEIGRIPFECTQVLLPPIYLTGLDVQNNPLHNNVWMGFSGKKTSDRSPASYYLMTNDTVIPTSKHKKTSYGGYVPKGILKSSWMAKHIHHVPSVIVLFFALDWDDGNYDDRMKDCSSLVDDIRNRIANRCCRIALVLLQKSLNIPLDDGMTTERATKLCDTCDIPAKSLFVLPFQDTQLIGYITKLEVALSELSSAYYQQEMKVIKNHKEQLNRTNHGLLFVRHQFKLGFFSEMRQDPQGAIKNYKQAYAHLMEIRDSETNIYEIMTIAGFINYKICKLLFMQNDPREAVSQFQKHINIFRSKKGNIELQFEQFAWLSKQWEIFGRLFDSAIVSGLVPSQTSHPGYYYYESAVLSMKRKLAIEPYSSIRSSFKEDAALMIVKESLQTEFYGQRPWRAGSLSLSPLDVEKEKESIQALQFFELKFINHPVLTISLLKEAISQFKKNRCPRMMRFMIVLTGRQYYDIKDYVSCLNHLNQVLPFYRTERWKKILVSILTKALSSAYFSCNDCEFVKLGLEFISSWVTLAVEVKSSVQSAIFSILKGQRPERLPLEESGELPQHVENMWQEILVPTKRHHYYVKMNTVVPFIEIKPMFTQSSYDWQEIVLIKVHVLLNSPMPIKFSKLALFFNEHHFNQFCEITDDEMRDANSQALMESSPGESLLFEPGKMKTFQFQIKTRSQDCGKAIEIVAISTSFGHESKIFCDWMFENPSDTGRYFNLPSSWSLKNEDEFKFQNITPNLVTKIRSRKPRVSVEINHENPALLNELYPIKITVKNDDSFPVHKVLVSVSRLEDSGDPGALIDFILRDSTIMLNSPQALSHSPVNPNSYQESILHFRASCLYNFKFLLTVTFEMDTPQSESDLAGPHTSKELLAIQVIQPFSVEFTVCNPLSLPAKSLRFMEPFIVRTQITSLSPFSIQLHDVFLDLNKSFFHHIPLSSPSSQKVLKPSDKSEHHFILYCDTIIYDPQDLGNLALRWERLSSNPEYNLTQSLNSIKLGGENQNFESTLRHSVTSYFLPKVTVESSLLYVETHLPKSCVTRQSSRLTYFIHNRTDTLLPILFTLESTDNFMYAGNRSVRLDIPAKSQCSQYIVLYPLICGQLTLPKVRIIVFPDEPERSVPLDDVLEEIIPKYLTVMPQEKIYEPSPNGAEIF